MWWVFTPKTEGDAKTLEVLVAGGKPVEFAAMSDAQKMADKLGDGAFIRLVYN